MQSKWRIPLHWWRYAAGVTLAGLVWLAGVEFTRLPVFHLKQLEVNGMHHVTLAQARLVTAQYVRGNLFDINLDQVRSGFGKLPWVRTVDVRRRWPDGLVVTLGEHQPLARWNEDALLDVQGDVFMAASDRRLPRLSGPEGSNQEVAQAWRAYAAVLAAIGRQPVAVALNDRRSWSVTLDNGWVIELGRDQALQRLQRWVGLEPAMLAQLGGQPVRVDLRYPQGFAVQVAAQTGPHEHEGTRQGHRS